MRGSVREWKAKRQHLVLDCLIKCYMPTVLAELVDQYVVKSAWEAICNSRSKDAFCRTTILFSFIKFQ